MNEHKRLSPSQMFHDLGNIIVSIAVGQSGLEQMSIFTFKIL